jgi:site-specific DNA recombinase
MTTNQIQAAIYARVSTEQQTETQTVASQLAALRSLGSSRWVRTV